jgi:hypothetical protein
LAPRLVALVDEAETKLGGDVRRAVVIDSDLTEQAFFVQALFDVGDKPLR